VIFIIQFIINLIIGETSEIQTDGFSEIQVDTKKPSSSAWKTVLYSLCVIQSILMIRTGLFNICLTLDPVGEFSWFDIKSCPESMELKDILIYKRCD